MAEQIMLTKKRKKLKKRIIIASVVVIVLAALILPGLLSAGSAAKTLTMSDTALISRTNLVRSILASGTVESANSISVYSSLAYPVKAVHVEVGDRVDEGQLLAELDAENIQNSISSQQVASSVQKQSAEAQVKSAQDSYDSFKQSLDSGLNSSLLAAQSQLDGAYNALITAQNNLSRFERSLASGQNTALISARSGLDSAQSALDTAQAAYDANPGEQTMPALNSAQNAYQNALAAYRAAESSTHDTLEDLRIAVSNAQDAYEKAQCNFESTQQAVNAQLQSYADAVNAAKSGTNTASASESVRQLRKTLADTKITAPCSGTVTAVYASVGGNGAGLLFVIEDVDHLIVKTTVKSYDIASITMGQKVLISSDATGDDTYEGAVSFIAPTSKKNSFGETDVTSDGVFETEIAVQSENSQLRIGMEAQLEYIIREEKNVLTVPYEAVYQNDDGKNCILIAELLDNGKYTLREVPVKLGLDDDLDIAVSGGELSEGQIVVQNPEKYRPLIGAELTENTATQDAWQVMMQ